MASRLAHFPDVPRRSTDTISAVCPFRLLTVAPSDSGSPGLIPSVALLRTARGLRAQGRGHAVRPLQGKNIVLLSEAPEGRDAALFARAAADLGARVARLRPSEVGLGSQAEADTASTARMLGRLYDAIECQGMDRALVLQLHRHAGVPVYDGIGCATHPCAAWVGLLSDEPAGAPGAGEHNGADEAPAAIQPLLPAHGTEPVAHGAIVQAILLETLR